MTVADIPGEITEIVDEYSSKFPNLCTRYISRDFSGNLDNLHYARDLTPQLTEKIDGLSKEEVDLILADEIRHAFPKSIERYKYTNGRVQGFKEFVRQFIINGKIRNFIHFSNQILAVTCFTLFYIRVVRSLHLFT
jgi:hypothetical protein